VSDSSVLFGVQSIALLVNFLMLLKLGVQLSHLVVPERVDLLLENFGITSDFLKIGIVSVHELVSEQLGLTVIIQCSAVLSKEVLCYLLHKLSLCCIHGSSSANQVSKLVCLRSHGSITFSS
jgi:hypothetical protein